MKITFSETNLNSKIQSQRKAYYNTLFAPLDGIWESLYIGGSTISSIKTEKENLGYCCIDNEKSLNQIYLKESHRYLMAEAIKQLIDSKMIVAAKLSSIEPISFNSCLAHSKSLKSDTINYKYTNQQKKNISNNEIQLRSANSDDIQNIKAFFNSEIGFNDQFGYTENLVNQKQLYLYEKENTIQASGECRPSKTQLKYADIGMVVKAENRKKGLGSKVLMALVEIAEKRDRKPICSTTTDNIAAQKAIEKAGFYPTYIIFKINF